MGGDLATRAAHWIEELGSISDESPRLTRTFLSPALTRAKHCLAEWMTEIGLRVHEDQAGNLIGRLDCGNPEAGTLVCGSHIDTVRNAGKYDGAMGVVAGLLAAREVVQSGQTLPYHLEVVAFSDEEGVRFQSTYLGSKFYAGRLTETELAARDGEGNSVREAIAAHQPFFPPPPPRRRLLGYVEAHIEQGPVLEKGGLALGVVTSIAGQTRARVFLEGKSGHAGTTPMSMRRDALAGAAECVTLIEARAGREDGLVATVGELRIPFAASNVIPGRVEFTLDIRDANDELRQKFVTELISELESRMHARDLVFRIEVPLAAPSTACSPILTESLAAIITEIQGICPRLVSGAGHDAVALAEVTEVAMLFVRCREGLSHHPDEFATAEDIGLAVQVLAKFLLRHPSP